MKEQKKKSTVSQTLVRHGKKLAVASGVASVAITTAIIVESEKHKHEAAQSAVRSLRISKSVSGSAPSTGGSTNVSNASAYLSSLSASSTFGKTKVSEITSTLLNQQITNITTKPTTGSLNVVPSSSATSVTAPQGDDTNIYYIANGTVEFGTSAADKVTITFANEPIFSGKTYSISGTTVTDSGSARPNTFTKSINQEKIDSVTKVESKTKGAFGASTNTNASDYEAQDGTSTVVSGVTVSSPTVTTTQPTTIVAGGYTMNVTTTVTAGSASKTVTSTWPSTSYEWSWFSSTNFNNVTLSGDSKNINVAGLPTAPAGTKIQYKINGGTAQDLSGSTITNSANTLTSISFQLASSVSGITPNGSAPSRTITPNYSATFKKAVDVSTLLGASNAFAFAGNSDTLTFSNSALDTNTDITYELTLGSKSSVTKGGTIAGNILSTSATLTDTAISYVLKPANNNVALYNGSTAVPASGASSTGTVSLTGLTDTKLSGVTKWIIPTLSAPTVTVTGADSEHIQIAVTTPNIPTTAATWKYELTKGGTVVGTVGGTNQPAGGWNAADLNTFLSGKNVWNASATAAGSYDFDGIKATATAVTSPTSSSNFGFANGAATQTFTPANVTIPGTKIIPAAIANTVLNAADIATKLSKGMTFTEPTSALTTAGMSASYKITTSLSAGNGMVASGGALYGTQTAAQAFLAANNAWNYGTNSYQITKVEVFAVGAQGYSVKGQLGANAGTTPSATKTLFESSGVPSGFNKVLNEVQQATDVTNAFVLTGVTDTSKNQTWDAKMASTFANLSNAYTVQYALDTTATPSWKPMTAAADLPVDGFNNDKTKRFLKIRLTPQTGFQLSTGTEKIIDISSSSLVQTVKTAVDVSKYVTFAHDTQMWGTNSKTAGTPSAAISTTASSTVDPFVSGNLKIVYSLNNFAGTTIGANNFGVPSTTPSSLDLAALRALFNGSTAGNLWNQASGNWAGDIWAKVVVNSTAAAQDFTFTNNTSTMVFDHANATLPTKYVDPTVTSAAVTTANSMGTYFGGIRVAGLHNAPTWTNVAAMSPADQAAYTVEYLVGNFADVNAANAATTWVQTFPTSTTDLDVTHANRHMFVRLTPKSGYTFPTTVNAAGKQIFDITTSSGIQNVQTSIDHLTDYAAWATSKIVFTGDTGATGTTSRAIVTNNNIALTGTEVEYSDNNFIANPSHIWTEAQLKTELAKGFGSVQIRNIKARLKVTDTTKYDIVNQQAGLVDVTGFKSFADISATLTDLRDGQNKIEVHGTVGKGIQIIPKNLLISSTLKNLGLVLQYSTDKKATWSNFVGKTGTPTSGNGFISPAAPNSEYQEIVPFNSGMSLDFRVVPQFQDDKTTTYTGHPSDDVVTRAAALKVKTNDPITTGDGTTFEWNLATLPVLVWTDSAVITTNVIGATLAGTTHDITLASGLQTQIQKYLDGQASSKPSTANTRPSGKPWDPALGFSKFTQIGYQVSFKSASNHGSVADWLFTDAQFTSWLKGTLAASTSVYNITNHKMQPLTAGLETMDWNNIDVSSFKAGWMTTDGDYQVSDETLVPLPATNVARWFDMTGFLNKLKNITYDGTTKNLTVPTGDTVASVQTAIDALSGANKFVVKSSAKKSGNGFDFTGTNAITQPTLPEINHSLELGYIIESNDPKFISSLQATPTTTNPTIQWDSTKAASTLLKFVHIDTNALSTIVFTGDTHHMAYTAQAALTNADDMGVMNANGTQKVEIYAQLDSTGALSTANHTAMPIDMMLDYMNGNLSATKTYGSQKKTVQQLLGAMPKALVFDGTWGRDAIKLSYRALVGYTIDDVNSTANQTSSLKAPNVSAVTRWLDISSLITSDTTGATAVKIGPKATTSGFWWDEADTKWTATQIWGNTWGHYLDDTNFAISSNSINANLKIKIQYSLDATGSTGWTDTMPTDLGTTPAANRKLWIKYVSDGTKYGAGTAAEDVTLSDTTAHDITTSSLIVKVPTKIDVTNADLSKIKFTGTTRQITEDITTANIPANAEVRYTLTDFQSPASKDQNIANTAKQVLEKMGIVPGSAPYTAYKASMTFAELTTFVNALTTAQATPNTTNPTNFLQDMWRGLIKARLIAKTGYTITEANDTAKRTNIDVTGLYTTRDLFSINSKMVYTSSSLSTNSGIYLGGTKDIADAVRVGISDDIYNFYTNNKLELQYTLNGKATATGSTIDQNASWATAPVANKATTTANGVVLPQVNHGFDVTLHSLTTIGSGATALSYSFIAFRFVPKTMDDGTTLKQTPTATASLNDWYNAAMTKVFVSNNQYTTLGSMIYNPQPADGFAIDTSQIPKQVHVEGILGGTPPTGVSPAIKVQPIHATGTTHLVDVVDADIAAARAQIDPQNSDKSADDRVNLMYAIDTKNGDFLDGNGTNQDALWLMEKDFEAYLNGNLRVSQGAKGLQVTNSNNSNLVVSPDVLTDALLRARKFNANDPFKPDYKKIDTQSGTFGSAGRSNSVFVRWSNLNEDYTKNQLFEPSDQHVYPLQYDGTTFRRWFDGNYYNQQLAKVEVSGTTESDSSATGSYTFDYTKAPDVSPAELTKLGLKVQYSFDHVTWQDNTLNFSTATWLQQVARKIYARVVPGIYTSTTAITTVPTAKPGQTAGPAAQSDNGLYVDYAAATALYGEMNTTVKKAGSTTEFAFKTYLNIESNPLTGLVISGNSLVLDGTTLDESAINNKLEKFNAVEIQYLYDGIWYNKTNLLAKMATVRTNGLTNANTAAALKLPTDFVNGNVKARWRVITPDSFTIKDEVAANTGVNAGANALNVKDVTSPWKQITATNLKTFINIWDVQDKISNDFRTTLTSGTNTGQAAVISLTGSVNKASGNFTLPASFTNWITTNHLTLQWSVKDAPKQDFPSTDWNDAKAYPQFMQDVRLDPTSKKLWVRFVPDSTSVNTIVPSSFLSNGTVQQVQAIEIDTTQLKFSIDADANALKAIAISGDTQNGLTIDTDPFLKAKLVPNSNPAYATVSGVPYFYTVDAAGNEVKMNEADANTFISTTAKLNVQFKAVQTRRTNVFVDPYSSNPVKYGDEVIFYNLADLQKAVQSGKFNFDKSSLRVAWYVGEKANYTLDTKAQNGQNPIWVQPTNLGNLKNTVYTDDVFVLTQTSLAVSGNNLKLNAPRPTQDVNTGPQYYDPKTQTSTAKKATDVLTSTFLTTLGLKLQYNWTEDKNNLGNPDNAQWSDVAPDGSTKKLTGMTVDQRLDGAKNYWIRFAPKDANLTKLASGTAGKETQVTKINVAQVKLAIPFAGANQAAILKQITDAALEGTTYDFKYTVGKELPAIGQSADFATVNKVHGHIQYSINNIFWGDTIADAFNGLADKGDHYGNHVQGFDKDRGDKLYIRYVYEETVGNVTPADSTKWVYTDVSGNEITLADLATKAFSINALTQPIFTDKSLALLTGQTSIVPVVPNGSALLNPNNSPDFAGVAWKDLANYGLFKPRFTVGSNDRVANFNYMWYDGFLKDSSATPSYLFKMGTNPFNPADVIVPTDDFNAFAPRHTHFEFYVYNSNAVPNWTKITNLKDLTRDSNHQYFRVQLVPDAGYTLGTGGTGFTMPASFVDSSTPAGHGQVIPSQEWQKDYSVTIELLTSNYTLPATNQTQIIGWNETTPFDPTQLIANKTYPENIPAGMPSALLKTTDASGDHKPSMSGTLKDIYLNLLDNGKPVDFTNANIDERKEYVVEWSVTNASGSDIPWLDSAGGAFAGWHPAVANSTPGQQSFSVTAPGSTVPWYGSYPVSLKNGDIVKLRLRARDGFVLSKDSAAKPTAGLPTNTKDGGYDAASKTSWWSHEMIMTPVSGLTSEIVVPKDFALFNSAHLVDLAGNPITENTNYPSVAFAGNEGTGTINITNRGSMSVPHFKYQVAVLHPFINSATYTAYKNAYDAANPPASATNPNPGPIVKVGVDVILNQNVQFSYQDGVEAGYSLKTIDEQIADYDNGVRGQTAFYKSPTDFSIPSNGLPGAPQTKDNWKNKVTWVDPSTVNNLKVGDIIFFRLVADSGFGFKWEDNIYNQFTDVLYPKDHTYDAFGTTPFVDPVTPTKTAPSFGFSKNEGVTPVIVRGLTVRPQFDVSSLQLINDTDPAKNINGNNNNITLNNVPDDSDAWIWQISPSGQNSWQKYGGHLPSNVKNNDKFDFRAAPKNAAYQLDPNYNNTVVTLTVSGLGDALDAQGIARPVIVFGGYEGKGTISSITEAAPGTYPWSPVSPTEPLGRPLLGAIGAFTPTGNELKWQYQVYDGDPTGLSANSLAAIPWVDQLPTNLKHGQYIRMRVGSVDPNKVALVKSSEFVYSKNPNTSFTGTVNSIQAQDSWFAVEGLKVDPKNVDYTITYQGWISKTTVSVAPVKDNLDVRAVTMEYSFDNGTTWWDPNSKQTSGFPNSTAQTTQAYIDEMKKKLNNNDVIKIRVKANDGFVFDVNDDDKANGIHVEKDAKTSTVYMWRDSWDTTVKGLLRWLDVDNVDIGQLSYTNMDSTHITNDPVTNLPRPVDPITGNQPGVWDGYAKTNPPTFGKLNTIIDATKSQTDPNNNGSYYSDSAVGYRYVIKRIDPSTGYALPDEISNTFGLSDKTYAPSNLSIGDTVYLELVSKDPSIQLSSNRRVQIKIANLDTVISDPVHDPNFTFTGKSGQGTIANIALPPLRTKWVYQILTPQVAPVVDKNGNPVLDANGNKTYPALANGYKYYDPSQPLPAIDPALKHSQPNLTEWKEDAPSDLKNGDYVIALLVPTQSGGGLVVQNLSYPDPATGKGQNIIPISKKWNLVAGLSERIDLSKYRFQFFDAQNPYNPTLVPDAQNPINYAFKLFGTQEGQAELKINAPLYIDPASPDYAAHKNEQLVDKSGNKMPDAYAQVLQWEFAISSSAEETSDLRYSPTLPTGLVNGQYIHVRMGAKPQIGVQTDSITVTGFTPYSFKIDGLTSPASITSKVVTLLGITLGGLATLGIATGLIIFLRKRRRKLHFSGKI